MNKMATLFHPKIYGGTMLLTLNSSYRILLGLWKRNKNEAEENHRKALERYEQQLESWKRRKSIHEEKEKIKQKEFPILLSQDINLMESVLREAIDSLSWPRETIISYLIAHQFQLSRLISN